MPSDVCEMMSDLGLVADASAAGYHEGIRNHGTCQLGMITTAQPLAFSRALLLKHGLERPYWNLACECPAGIPAWMTSFTITPSVVTPPPPGFLPVVFTPGVPPVLPAVPPVATTAFGLTTPTVIPFSPPLAEQQIAALAAVPGGFASWSMPGTVYQFLVTGSVPPGLAPGLYRHAFYVTAAPAFNSAARERLAKFSFGLVVGDTR
jgi:hypothetical protein